jgi:predicted MFS family arabinose efflux permease
VWSDRSVRRVVLARFISRIGGEAAFFVGIWGKAAFDLEATPGQLAVVMAALGVASIIGASIAGVLIDRYDPRRVLIWGEVVFIPVALGLVFAETIPSMAVMTFFLGLVGAPVYTAISSFAPFLSDDEPSLARINGYIEAASWTAFVVGPAAGAVIAASYGVDGIFILDAATSAIGAILVIPVTLRVVERQEKQGSGFTELRQGFAYAYGNDRLRFYIWLGTTVWLLFGFFSALEPLFFRDVVGVEVETLGWVNSLIGLGLISGTWLSGRLPKRLRNARTLTVLVGLNALGVAFYVGTGNLAVVMTAGVIWGALIGVLVPLHRTLIQVNTSDDLVGRIMGVNQMHHEVGHLIPLAIAPVLAAMFGVQATMLASGLVAATGVLVFWPGAARIDKVRDHEVPAPSMPDPESERRAAGH